MQNFEGRRRGVSVALHNAEDALTRAEGGLNRGHTFYKKRRDSFLDFVHKPEAGAYAQRPPAPPFPVSTQTTFDQSVSESVAGYMDTLRASPRHPVSSFAPSAQQHLYPPFVRPSPGASGVLGQSMRAPDFSNCYDTSMSAAYGAGGAQYVYDSMLDAHNSSVGSVDYTMRATDTHNLRSTNFSSKAAHYRAPVPAPDTRVLAVASRHDMPAPYELGGRRLYRRSLDKGVGGLGNRLFNQMDADHDGLVDWEEFMTYLRAEEERNPLDTRFRRGSLGTGATSKVEKRLMLRDFFDDLDRDRSGKVDRQELVQALLTQPSVARFFNVNEMKQA